MSKELDVQIAELVFEKICIPEGSRLYRVLRDRDGEIYDVKEKITYEPEQLCGTWEGRRLSECIPAYSTDLNACRLAEQRLIELGKGRNYARTLVQAIKALMTEKNGTGAGWELALLTAPAEARCRAMLDALKGEKK